MKRSWLAAIIPFVCYGTDWLTADPTAERAVPHHVRQSDLEAGRWSETQIIEAGRRLFAANFTKADGVGRPAATGNPFPVLRRDPAESIDFARGAGPDANSCASCHHQPIVGGAGDFAVNVFTGLGPRTISAESIELTLANERGTPALQGSGLLELLAREITIELHSLRNNAIDAAKQSGVAVEVQLNSKGISYGTITVSPSGEVDTSHVDGIDRDLVIRPFGAKGTITSLREFTINASNLHHGMQATERYGKHRTNTADFDQDGVEIELTEGDVTALTLYQAALSAPGRLIPAKPGERDRVARGEALFKTIGCTVCHPLELPLASTLFTEPNPFNFEGNLRPTDDRPGISIDLAALDVDNRIEKQDGRYLIRAMTDFKRHDISDDEKPHLRNEVVFERLIPTELFLTRPLWGCGSTAPYGHRGDLVTLSEVIDAHGGEARPSRLEYERLATEEQLAVRQFLKSLAILPPGTPAVVIEQPPTQLPY